MYHKGFWLILIENDDSEMAVACQILSRENGRLRLQAHIPPTWYPQTFTAYKVHEDGEILGVHRLPPDQPIRVPTHAGVYSVDLDFEPTPKASRGAKGAEHEPLAGSRA